MTKLLARIFLALTGWRPEGERPSLDKFVLIAAPHTSNWNLAYLLALGQVFGVRMSWMGKHTLFHWPMGPVMTRVGGTPVRRHRRENLVTQMAEAFRRSSTLALTVPAESTRGYRDHWKSGFYRIAQEAQVPILMGYLDYARKCGSFGPQLLPTGDVKRDMDKIRSFYADKTAKYPDCFSQVRVSKRKSATSASRAQGGSDGIYD